MNPTKKVMAIQDLSCYGRASLTTIIPIMSMLGVQVCPMPTSVLSTHTGGFGIPVIVDLSDFLENTKSHWEKLDIKFEAIYTGYLSSAKQGEIIKDIMESFKNKEILLAVDPVLGDEGIMYNSLNSDTVKAMKELIAMADIITPNLTEMALLLGREYEEVRDSLKVEKFVKELSNLGPKKIVVTSAESMKGKDYLDTITYSKKENKLFRISIKKVNKSYPGTGDAFASVLISKILAGYSLEESAQIASEYVARAVEISSEYDYDSKEGILLEKTLYLLNN